MLSIITVSMVVVVLAALAVYASLGMWVALTADAISDAEWEPNRVFE